MDLERFKIRTDLAFESLDLERIDQVDELINDEFQQDEFIIKRTIINNAVGERINKKPGVYYCLDTTAIKTHDQIGRAHV